jgi:hypothetical protein
MIGDSIFAMSCHALQPLLRGVEGNVKFADRYFYPKKLLVVRFDYGYSGGYYEFPVKQEVTCSGREYLDIGLLQVDLGSFYVRKGKTMGMSAPKASAMQTATSVPPPRLAVYLDDPKLLLGDQAALIGYADLLHFIDEHSKEMFAPFIKEHQPDIPPPDYLKFAALDWIAHVDCCTDKLSILWDTADTTLGQSGSPVIDFFGGSTLGSPKPTVNNGLVVGVHICCSAYFVDDKDRSNSELPDYDDVYKHADLGEDVAPALRATHIRRTLANQDISMHSILSDPDLCKVLQGKINAYDVSGQSVSISSCDPFTISQPMRKR